MSSSAILFLTCLAASILTFLLTGGWLETAAKAAAIFFGLLFLIAVAVGRRIKFDPVLR